MKHRRRRYPIPGHPSWVGHYAYVRHTEDSRCARYELTEQLYPVRWRVWRAGRLARAGALRMWRSLYERAEQEGADHVRMQ